MLNEILSKMTHVSNSGKTIILCWTPSHVSIHGTETADSAAKPALSFPITNVKLPARELIPHISKFCLDEWQDVWDCCTRHAELVTFIFTSTGHILGPYGNTTMKSDDITTLSSSVVLHFVPVLHDVCATLTFDLLSLEILTSTWH